MSRTTARTAESRPPLSAFDAAVAQYLATDAADYCIPVADGAAVSITARAGSGATSVRFHRPTSVITTAVAIRAIEQRRLGKDYRTTYPNGITAKAVREEWGYDPRADVSTEPALARHYRTAVRSY